LPGGTQDKHSMPEKKYRIIVVDDHEVFRMGLKLLLEKVSDVEVSCLIHKSDESLN
jgi:DNA-binding NarL/FixJ family response regulator